GTGTPRGTRRAPRADGCSCTFRRHPRGAVLRISSPAAPGPRLGDMTISDTRPVRGDLLDVVRRRPLLSFFVLANAMSWLAWLPYILSENGLGIWGYRFPELLGTSQFTGVLPGAYLGPIASALF